ncbi:MAG: AraC family transcriptional regulator [Lachnospiraceae bacterium]|nr:AraC family transcriptional regulator [Lachnospiraceae bacterium]
MKKYAISQFPYEEMYQYIGTSETQILHLLSGITYPDPSYEIKRMHSDCYSIEYVYQGEGVIQENSHLYKVSAGDFFILHPHTFHHYYANPQNPWKKIFINVNKKTDFATTLLHLYKIDDIIHFGKTNSPLYLEEILELFKTDEQDITHKLEDLIICTITALARLPKSTPIPASPVVNAKAYIDNNITERIVLSDVAKLVSLDASYLSRAFKSTYGISPSDYVKKQKMALAESFLANTVLSIEDIAARLSFYDIAHFSCAFTKYHGISPSEYRNSPPETIPLSEPELSSKS